MPIKVLPPDRPARTMMREQVFQDSVFDVSTILDKLGEGSE